LVVTHPFPLKYFTAHERLPFWKDGNMEALAGQLLHEDRETMEAYD